MIIDSIKFHGHRCFKRNWAGFESIKAINVIIGRNNTGKTHLLDLAELLCAGKLKNPGWRFSCSGKLDLESLQGAFQGTTSGGDLNGNHWNAHGIHFINKRIFWEMDESLAISNFSFEDGFKPDSPWGEKSTAIRINKIKEIAKHATHILNGRRFRRLWADRDIRPENPITSLPLNPDGSGATNIIRRYILTSNSQYPREIIQTSLLKALNEIFGKDGHFDEIQVKIHDEKTTQHEEGHWEIFLGEKRKGLIPLSNSGSGLKTVILVLLNLLVVPEIEKKQKSNFVFAFEELENNLHPALLRRLFQFLENYAITENSSIFLTTHSSVALDLFGVSNNAQIVHVTHDGEFAKAETVRAHFDRLGVISELGAKPSDLLQANGIIWVEGPSDCIYFNRWIDLYTNGRLQEGRDYQCAFYGGSLLARTQFVTPENAEAELVNLFKINSNIVVVCDGDYSSKKSRVKDRVRRIRSEVRMIPGAHNWVTNAREIENYIPGEVLAKALGFANLPDPTQFESFFPRKNQVGHSYVETRLSRKGLDKMDLAILCAPHMKRETMIGRFEWESQMKQIVGKIDSWNN